MDEACLWPVVEDYAITGPKGRRRLVEAGRIVRLYPLAGVRELLPNELAKLREDDKQAEAAVRAFAKRYGLLGRAWMFGREKFPKKRAAGERLDWIWVHARTVTLVAEGIAVLKSCSEAQAREFFLRRLNNPYPIAIRERIIRWEPWRVIVPTRGWEGRVQRSPDGRSVKQRMARVSYLRAVAEALHGIIGPNIRGMRLGLVVTDKDAIRSTFTCSAMIEGVYSALLDMAEAKSGALRRCRECNTLFIVTHGRQLFCPPGPTRKESHCALRWHQRQYDTRAKQAKRKAQPRRKR